MPLVVVEVIVALPTARAVTLPEASTEAMVGALLLHVTVLSVVLSGATVAVRVTDSPILIAAVV